VEEVGHDLLRERAPFPQELRIRGLRRRRDPDGHRLPREVTREDAVNSAFGVFWEVLAIASLAWYALLTGYVAVKGIVDIKRMLGRLSDRE
jgi:hypothetical protein